MHAEFGAWYPRFNNWNMHKPWDRFRNDVLELFDKRLRSTEAKVLWRAYGPTHFGGSTGMQLSPVTSRCSLSQQLRAIAGTVDMRSASAAGTFTALESVLEDLPTPQACEPAAYGGDSLPLLQTCIWPDDNT